MSEFTQAFELHNMVPGPVASAVVQVTYKGEDGILKCYGTSAVSVLNAEAADTYAPGCVYTLVDGTSSKLYINEGAAGAVAVFVEIVGTVTGTGVTLVDAFANYTAENVEAALAEIGGVVYTNRFTIIKTIEPTAEAAAATSYGKIFIAPRACTVTKISEVHTVAGDDAGAVTLHVERLQGTETSGNGDNLHTTGIDLKGTAETPVSPTLLGTGVTELAAGDRLNLVDTGTLATLAGLCVTIELEWDVVDNS